MNIHPYDAVSFELLVALLINLSFICVAISSLVRYSVSDYGFIYYYSGPVPVFTVFVKPLCVSDRLQSCEV